MSRAQAVSSKVEDGVAVITINHPPVNSLAPNVLIGLKAAFDEAHSKSDVSAIVVRGSNNKFSGGFDIGAIVQFQQNGSLDGMVPVSVPLMTETIEAGKKPVVAAVEGLALGGGLELAMACHARIGAPGTQLGLPELQLGIIPGFGGTQRLPRLVGLQKACEMMLLSKPIKAEEALDLGLLDALSDSEFLLETAKKWALDIAHRRRPWLQTLYRTDRLETLGDARDILQFARQQVKKTAPGVPHPLGCLDAVEAGVTQGGYFGILKEDEIFRSLVLGDVSKALAHIFFSQRNTSKVPGVTDRGLRPRQIKRVAVIGGGLMGSGIVTAFISVGIPVLLKEVNANFLQQGLDRIRANFGSRLKKGALSKAQVENMLNLVKGTLDYTEFGSVDIVIEAVIEDIPLKQKIFADLEKFCSPSCVLASNTSTIDLNRIAEKTKSQNRIIGAHFFSPAHVMPLLEIVRTESTSPQIVLDLLTVGKVIKKTPVVVRNCTGFAVNRVFFPYTMAALLLSDLGVDPYRIDKVIKGFGMPMGPFRLTDLVGMGVASAVGQQFYTTFTERAYKAIIVPTMLQDNRLGEKNGKGFYLYDSKRNAKPDPQLGSYLEASRKSAGLVKDGKWVQVSNQDIVEMIFFPVVNEACRVLHENVVVRAADLDIASVMAMGFPAVKGGIVFWADLVDGKYIFDRLSEWESKYGSFFKPSEYLKQCAQQGIKLSQAAVGLNSRL